MQAAKAPQVKLPQLGFDLPYLTAEWKATFSPSTMLKEIWAGVTVALLATTAVSVLIDLTAGVIPGRHPGNGCGAPGQTNCRKDEIGCRVGLKS